MINSEELILMLEGSMLLEVGWRAAAPAHNNIKLAPNWSIIENLILYYHFMGYTCYDGCCLRQCCVWLVSLAWRRRHNFPFVFFKDLLIIFTSPHESLSRLFSQSGFFCYIYFIFKSLTGILFSECQIQMYFPMNHSLKDFLLKCFYLHWEEIWAFGHCM